MDVESLVLRKFPYTSTITCHKPDCSQASCIITLRIIFILGALFVSQIGGFYEARPCDQITNIFGGSREAVLALYPDCASYFSGESPDQHVVVEAKFSGNPAQLTVALGLNFGSAGWLAFAIHAVGVEIYVRSLGLDFTGLNIEASVC